MAVVAVLGAHELRPAGDGAGQLARHLDRFGAGGREERVAQRLGQQAGQCGGALGAPQRRQQPVTHVVLAHGGRQRLDGEVGVVAEVEHAARAAAVEVIAAVEVPDPDALTTALDEVDPERAEGLGLVRREVARDQLERLGTGCRMVVHDGHRVSLSGSSWGPYW